MKTILFTLLFSICSFNFLFAQSFNAHWNEKILTGKKEGFLTEVLDQNDKYYYVNFNYRGHTIIRAFNNEDLSEQTYADLQPIIKKDKILKEALLTSVKATNDLVIYIFRLEKGKKIKYHYITSTPDLTDFSEPIEITELNLESNNPTLTFVENPHNSDVYLTLSYINKDLYQHINYTIFNKEGVVTKHGDYSLDIKKSKGILGSYYETNNINSVVTKDGNLAGMLFIKMPKSEKLNEGEFGRYLNVLYSIDKNQDKISILPLIDNEINVYRTHVSLNTKGDAAIYSYSSRKNEDPKGEKITDLFYAEFDLKSKKLANPAFIPLNEKDFGVDPKTKYWEVSFDGVTSEIIDFGVEKVVPLPNGNELIISTSSYSYEVTKTNQKSGYTSSTNYCQKYGLLLVEKDPSNKLVSAHFNRRNAVMLGTNVKDINTFIDNDHVYVTYTDQTTGGNVANPNGETKLDYVSYDYNTKKVKKDELKFSKDKHTYFKNEFSKNNQFLMLYNKHKMKTWVMFSYPILIVIALPTYIILGVADLISPKPVISNVSDRLGGDYFYKSKLKLGSIHLKHKESKKGK